MSADQSTPPSREGHKYVMNFVDEYSSMIFISFMRSKEDSMQALQKFLADVALIGQPKEIHSDNGGEYVSHAFQKILTDRGI